MLHGKGYKCNFMPSREDSELAMHDNCGAV
jgi:hypothetical protein